MKTGKYLNDFYTTAQKLKVLHIMFDIEFLNIEMDMNL